MTFEIRDLSDNNAMQQGFPGFAGVILKLYPTGGVGGTWLTAQHNLALAWKHTHPDFIIGFYAADSTPTWGSAHGAAGAHGIDLRTGPFAFDLREFGFPLSHVAQEIKAAKAAGQRTGNYWRLQEADGASWHWVAHYLPTPPTFGELWQYTSHPLDTSKPRNPAMTLEQFKQLTITTYAPPPPKGGHDLTEAETIALIHKELGTPTPGARLDYLEGFEDGAENRPPTKTTTAYKIGHTRGVKLRAVTP